MNKLYRLKFISFCLFFTLLFGCTPDIEENLIVTYRGMVQENSSKEPLSNIDVIVTDGSNIHSMTKTDIDGSFIIKVKVNEIDENYYILIGDETCEQKQIKFPGFSDETINLGLISVVGPQLPIVNTDPNFSIDVNNLYCGGTVINSGRLDVTDRGICYSLSSYPTISDSKVSEGKGEGKFELVIKNLELGSIYYFRAFATNSKGTSYGTQYRVKMEEGVATVSDVQISEIKAINAVCSAEVINDGGFEIVKRGFCWSKQQFPTTSDCVVTDGGKIGKFSLSLSDLEPQTTYYVRAFAENSTSVTYSDQLKFETISGLPTVVTGDVINISSNSAECSGVISDNGGYTINKCGVCWSKSTSTPTINDSHTEDISLSGKFNSVITSLQPSTVYYIRAYATNSMGTVYGQTKKITTTDGLPIVKTSLVKYGTTSLECYGNVTEDSGFPITKRGFCYSTNPTPTIYDNVVLSKTNATGSYTLKIDNLEEGTTYYTRAFAENEIGVSYGDILNVTTQVTITFSVVDKDNLPIPNAIIYFGQTSNEYTCDANGQLTSAYKIGDEINTFWASASGYTESVRYSDKIVSKYNKEYKIVLNKDLPYVVLPELNLMVQKNDLGRASWSDAKALCEASTLGGYNDWRLPTSAELSLLYARRTGIGNFNISYYYWSSTESSSSTNSVKDFYEDDAPIKSINLKVSSTRRVVILPGGSVLPGGSHISNPIKNYAYTIYFYNGYSYIIEKDVLCNVRAVRTITE